MLKNTQLAVALSTVMYGLGRLRYLRASLWLLPIQILTVSILVGVSRVGPKDDIGSLHETYFAASVALGIYIAVITLSHFGIGAWSAARGSYDALRCTAHQVLAVLIVLLVLIPVYVVVIDPSIMNYFACPTLKCSILAPLGATLLCVVLALGAVIPTSILWFLLAKPKVPSPAFKSGALRSAPINLATHIWKGHTIEVESYTTPKLFWFSLAFSVRVDNKVFFQSPDKLEGLHTIVPFEVAGADSVKRGRVVSGHPCSSLYAVYRVFIDDQEVAKGAVRARNWYVTYGIIATAGVLVELGSVLF
jgi:hypothetical protein